MSNNKLKLRIELCFLSVIFSILVGCVQHYSIVDEGETAKVIFPAFLESETFSRHPVFGYVDVGGCPIQRISLSKVENVEQGILVSAGKEIYVGANFLQLVGTYLHECTALDTFVPEAGKTYEVHSSKGFQGSGLSSSFYCTADIEDNYTGEPIDSKKVPESCYINNAKGF